MPATIICILLSYLSGSILYARVFSGLLKKGSVTEQSKDQNPGTSNAFRYGGFWCGTLTLLGDLFKGFVPVYFYTHYIMELSVFSLSPALVFAAPVIGHTFPLFYRFRGGKGIAATFGCLLGLLPIWRPLIAFVALFILFSTLICITSHFHRTLLTYLCAALYITFFIKEAWIWVGFLLIAGVVGLRMHLSKEERERLRIKLLWMH